MLSKYSAFGQSSKPLDIEKVHRRPVNRELEKGSLLAHTWCYMLSVVKIVQPHINVYLDYFKTLKNIFLKYRMITKIEMWEQCFISFPNKCFACLEYTST